MDEMPKTIHVLDLFCGTRFIGKPVQPPVLREAIHSGRVMHYVGVDQENQPERGTRGSVKYELIRLSLNLKDPAEFERQLRDSVRGQTFDQVHANLDTTEKQAIGESEAFFRVIGSILKPGGTFRMMSSVEKTAFLDLPIVNPLVSDRYKSEIFDDNFRHLSEKANNSGLRVKLYGMRYGSNWLTSNSYTITDRSLPGNGFHTDWPSFSYHLAILEKPTESKS